MRKITLVSDEKILGMGYMGNSQDDERCLEELREQINRSRIRGELIIEETDGIDMTELGDRMESYREYQECLEEMNNDREIEENRFLGYNIMDLLRR